MGRARNQMLAAVTTADAFRLVIGDRRGLKEGADFDRLLAETPYLISAIQDEEDQALLKGLTILGRRPDSVHPEMLELKRVTVETLTYEIVQSWGRPLQQMLDILGLENNYASPWLVQQKPLSTGRRSALQGRLARIVHIKDLSVGTDTGNCRTFCGIECKDTVAGRRGAWRNPSKGNGSRCSRCETHALSEQDVHGRNIPALSEPGNATLFIDEWSQAINKNLERQLEKALPQKAADYQQMMQVLHQPLREKYLQRLAEIAKEDPLPIVLANVPLRIREGCSQLSYKDAQLVLDSLPWHDILDSAFPQMKDSDYKINLDSSVPEFQTFESRGRMKRFAPSFIDLKEDDEAQKTFRKKLQDAFEAALG